MSLYDFLNPIISKTSLFQNWNWNMYVPDILSLQLSWARCPWLSWIRNSDCLSLGKNLSLRASSGITESARFAWCNTHFVQDTKKSEVFTYLHPCTSKKKSLGNVNISIERWSSTLARREFINYFPHLLQQHILPRWTTTLATVCWAWNLIAWKYQVSFGIGTAAVLSMFCQGQSRAS